MSAYTYILANRPNGVLYIGVTSDLIHRMDQHRTSAAPSFVSRYNVTKLVHYEVFEEISSAIQREKSLKKWPRRWKIELIGRDNPNWTELYESLW